MISKIVFRSYLWGISMGFILLSCKGNAQNFSTKNVSRQLISNYYSPDYSNNSRAQDIFSVSSDLLKGNDHTEVIQKAIDANQNILLPNTVILINGKGIKIGSNKKVIFQKNTVIKFLGPANGKFSDIIKIYNAHNVEVINAVVIGSRNNKITQSGQWSAGISVLNSSNIKIINPKISETFGDGIFIGSEDGGFCENVTVSGGWIDVARRNGISITSGKQVLIQNVIISNTYGHDPESGIDIEPSWDKDILENITVSNVCTFNNGSAGISINLNGLSTANAKDIKVANIVIDKHTDLGSRHGFLTSLNNINNRFDVKGNITVKNSNWKSSRDVAYWKTPQDHSINIIFSGIKINDTQKQRDFESSVRKLKNTRLIQ